MGRTPPVFMLSDPLGAGDFDDSLIGRLRGSIYVDADTPDVLAKFILLHFLAHAEAHRTRFFGATLNDNETGNEMWTCTDHEARMFDRKSPIRRTFFDHIGETLVPSVLDKSVVDLRDLLIHEGPVLGVQK